MAKKKTRKLKVNVKFIEKLKATLRADPRSYDQNAYQPQDHRDDIGDHSYCNTAVCLAGHAYLLAGHTLKQLDRVQQSTICEVARKKMGLEVHHVDILFGGTSEWPDEFHFNNDAPRKEAVKKACAFLDAVVEKAIVETEHAKVLAMDLW